jgi:hypothetical protein
MTYCLEEGLNKLEKVKEYEKKFQQQINKQPTKEDKTHYKELRSVCKGNFQLAEESIWNIK